MPNLRERSEILKHFLIPENAGKAIEALTDMKWISNSTGVVYEQQLNLLKKLANLCFHPETAVISINQDTRFVDVVCPKPTVNGHYFSTLVTNVLGSSWKATVKYEPTKRIGKDRSKQNRANPGRKGRSRTSPKRKRASSRP